MKNLRLLLGLVVLLLVLSAQLWAGELKGRLDAITPSDSSLTIAGITIFTQDALIRNEYDQAIPFAALNVGDFLMVDGEFVGQGQFEAHRIQLDFYGKDVIKGKIEAVDLNNHVIIIAGVKVQINNSTWLDDDDDMMIDFIQLTPSSYVRCWGHWAGNLSFVADRVELKD